MLIVHMLNKGSECRLREAVDSRCDFSDVHSTYRVTLQFSTGKNRVENIREVVGDVLEIVM